MKVGSGGKKKKWQKEKERSRNELPPRRGWKPALGAAIGAGSYSLHSGLG